MNRTLMRRAVLRAHRHHVAARAPVRIGIAGQMNRRSDVVAVVSPTGMISCVPPRLVCIRTVSAQANSLSIDPAWPRIPRVDRSRYTATPMSFGEPVAGAVGCLLRLLAAELAPILLKNGMDWPRSDRVKWQCCGRAADSQEEDTMSDIDAPGAQRGAERLAPAPGSRVVSDDVVGSPAALLRDGACCHDRLRVCR
jgi:hypothetical protein